MKELSLPDLAFYVGITGFNLPAIDKLIMDLSAIPHGEPRLGRRVACGGSTGQLSAGNRATGLNRETIV